MAVLDKTRNYAVSRRSRATKAKKCTKKRDARAKLFFANINHCFFAVLVAVAVVVAYTPYSYLSVPSSSWLRKPPAIYFRTP